MLKKLSTFALAAMIALPSAAIAGGGADNLSAQIDRLTQDLNRLKQEMADLRDDTEESAAEIEERAERWDLAARFQFSGDARTMLTGVSADIPSAYTAMDVGKGVVQVLDAGATFPAIQAGFNANPLDPNTYNDSDPLSNLTNALSGLTTAQVSGAFQGAAVGSITTAQADDLATIFTNPVVGGVLTSFAAGGATIGQITGAFANTEALVGFMKQLTPAARKDVFAALTSGYAPDAEKTVENDTIWTNRFRLNMRVKATENLEFKGRLAMYKAWGMQNNPVDYTENAGMGGGPFMLNSLMFDGSATRQPTDSILRVDRGFLNWNNIADQPIWFSIGRRPTTDGPPAQLRLGADKKMATPVNYMDYPFDGFSLGYAYNTLFGLEDFPGRVRFCYGRGFESGPTDSGDGLRDVDFGGISWDVYSKGDRFLNIQSFGAFDMFNVPDNIDFVNPIEYFAWQLDSSQIDPTDPNKNLILDRANLGNIYHTDAVYMSKVNNLHYFLTLGWSRTDAQGVDELGNSLLGSWWNEPEDKDGYSTYIGVRYDMPNHPFKLGIEYNHGTKNWISFTPGNDDLYASKLATRGDVVEAYTIWDIPAGEVLNKFGKAFIRLGYQHYEYDYTGSGFWLGEPLKTDELAGDPLSAQFYTPVESMDQIYLSMEAWF